MKNDTNSAAACVPSRLLKEVRVQRVQVADGESHVSTSSCSTEALKDKADSRRDPRAVPSAPMLLLSAPELRWSFKSVCRPFCQYGDEMNMLLSTLMLSYGPY